MEEGSFHDKSEKWMKENQPMVRDTMRWIFLGAGLFLLATGALLFSEIRQVLLQRQLDELVNSNRSIPEDLAEQKASFDAQRPYISCGAVGGMIFSCLISLIPLCTLVSSLMASMGYRYTGCELVAVLGAILISTIWSLFLFALIWSCTRPWTAALCMLIALVGEIATESLDGPAIVMWIILSIGSAYVFFRYGRQLGVGDEPERSTEKAPLLPA